MASRLELRKSGTTERIYFRPQEGRPSSTPSVAIRESGADLVASSTSNVTQDTVNTTTSASASAKDTTVTLTSATGVETYQTHPDDARGMYLLTNSLGQKEWVRVKAVNSSTKVVTLDEPLAFDHASGAAFVSTVFYYTVQSAQLTQLKELLVARATYTIDSMSYQMDVPFDVVLVPLHNPLTAGLLKQERPGLSAQEASSTWGSDFADFRARAWDRVCQGIRRHCTGKQIGEAWRPAMLRTPGDVEEWALAEFDLLCVKNGVEVLRGVEPVDAYTELKQERNNLRDASLASLRFMDIDEDEVMSDDEKAPIEMELDR